MSEVNPRHYLIQLEPDLKNFTFNGMVEIEVETDDLVKKINLNAFELAIWSCKFEEESGFIEVPFHYDPKLQKLTLDLQKEMSGRFKLKINYVGQLNDKLLGFYRSKYVIDGDEKYIGVTQFEENHARQAFPCFDHPSKKATFDIEFIIEEHLKAIANTLIREEKKLEDGRKLVKFETTPKMSSYLLFFGVGDFEFIEDKKDRILQRLATTPGKTKYGSFGLEFSKKVLEFGEDYTGVEYPIAKMDQIAVPDFAFGAMENFGAITYRENLLLVYPGITSAAGLERIAEVIAHEWAHQWFGNLVSPQDFKYLWLNESFATLFGYAITDHYYPEWGIWDQFLSTETSGALERDALIETFPIELPGEGDEVKINPATAPIIYNKGGSILQMIRGYLGEDKFRQGIKHFLSKHKFGNTTSIDYWVAFEEATGDPINEMMECWIHQPGFPFIEVKKSGDELVITQQRFTYLPHKSDQKWLIPITLKYYANDGKHKSDRVLLKDASISVKLPDNVIAFKLNVEQTGFYRVKYEKENLEALGSLVANKTLPAKDRYGLQNDLYAFVRSGAYSLDDYLDFLRYYAEEDAYLPTVDIAGNLIHAYNVVDAKREKISSIGRKISVQVLEKIGFEPKEGDLHTTLMLRSALLWAGFRFGDKKVAQFGSKKYSELMKGMEVHSDILANVMRIGAATDSSSYDWLIKKLESADTGETEKMNIYRALGSFGDKDTLIKALKYTLKKVPISNRFIPMYFAATNLAFVDMIWQWYLNNIEELEKLTPDHYERVISSVVSLGGLDKEEEVMEFFKDYMHKRAHAKDTIKMTLERLEINSNLKHAQ